MIVRRITGESMSPTLQSGDIIFGRRLKREPRVGDIVIVMHDGLEKIKRIERIKNAQVFVVGDNPAHSTDSRHFGWLDQNTVIAKVVWPRRK